MFDSVGAFRRQFTPFEEGYLLYPSRKGGGKFVTAEEYDRLVRDWERFAGKSGLWKMIGGIVLALLLWTMISEALSLPDWSDTIIIVALVAAQSTWVLWVSFAPRRLVKDRPEATPPRPISEARREVLGALNWPFVIAVLLFSGMTLWGAATASERTWSTWAWLVGSGLMFAAYLWIAFRKLLEGRR